MFLYWNISIFFWQYFSASCDDLTRYFPNGVASIIVEQDSAPWQVFTEVGYEGNPKYLYPGNYDDLNELGLEKPVKSFRTAPVSLSLITYLIRTVSHSFRDNLTFAYRSSPLAWKTQKRCPFRLAKLTIIQVKIRSSQVGLQVMKVLKIQAQARFDLVPPIDMNYQKWHSCSSADQCNHDLRQLFLIAELGKLILTNPMELMFIVFEVRFCFKSYC